LGFCPKEAGWDHFQRQWNIFGTAGLPDILAMVRTVGDDGFDPK
jgi:hypothetical protein